MEKLKNMKGITLVSLVITIIVLIILAAVSINLTIGTDGIITRAKEAAENMEIAAKEEQEMLNSLYGSLGSFESSQGGLQGGTTVGGGTATAAQVLEGVTFSSNLGKELLGTMKNNGAVTATIAPGETYTIPEGYHNGEGTVTATKDTSTYNIVELGTISTSINDYTRTFSAANISGYENMTEDNFIVEITGFNFSGADTYDYDYSSTNRGFSKTYDSTTGILTVTGLVGQASGRNGNYDRKYVNANATAIVWCKY